MKSFSLADEARVVRRQKFFKSPCTMTHMNTSRTGHFRRKDRLRAELFEFSILQIKYLKIIQNVHDFLVLLLLSY
jgi:hypothetical protein